MKHIFKYLGALLAVVLIGATFTACSEDDAESANVGLGIKTFFPTKVVTNQPITINGSGFDAITEIEFPGGAKVTNFEIVGNDMVRVNAPAGIAADGGKIVVRTANGEAESRQSLTLGHTNVTGFSKQPGEEAAGGELITVYGTDLEFINSVELLDPDSVFQLIDHKDFYRKGTSNLIFRVPKKDIYDGTFVGYLHTYDGQKIALPELTYKPAADEGHWETVRTSIWKNTGSDEVNWNGTYRFALEGHDGNNECIAEIPQEVWEKMKTETFFISFKPTADWYQIRITNGWWDTQWLGKDNDFSPNNMADQFIDNGDGTYSIQINFGDDPLVGTLDEKHLLFTGSGYIPLEIYFEEEVWVGGGGHMELIKTSFWKNGGSDEVNWNGTYRFALEGHDGNNECIAEIPQEIWDKIKTGPFFISFKPTADWYQIRITNGWWDTQWLGKDNDFSPNNMADQFIDNGDGTYSIQINFGDDPLVGTLDEKHLLFTGSGYIPLEIYFEEEVWVGGGGHMELIKTSFWKNGGSDEVNWNGTYRLALEGHDGNNECIAEIPQDIWDKIKTGPFFISFKPTADWYQIRITNGWWDTQWLGKDNDFSPNNMADQIIDNGDGTYSILINFGDDPLVGTLDEKHLLFTGSGYLPLELYFEEEVWVGGGDSGSSDIDIAAFTLYEDRSANLEWPYFPSWSDNSGKLRIMRGLGDTPIETLGLTTSSKFVVYKEAGTTGQIQFNNPNWVDLQAGCNDWDGSAETIEVPITEEMLKCISGEISDGWSDTAIILQGDGMKVTKIVIVP